MLLDRQTVLLNPRLTLLFSLGFALLLFAIYHITVYRETGGVQNIGAGGNQSVLPFDFAMSLFQVRERRKLTAAQPCPPRSPNKAT